MSPSHVLGHSRFRYVEPEEAEFGLDPWHAPRAVFLRHPTDQRDDLWLDPWPAALIDPEFPTPEQLEPLSMPSDNGGWPDDG